MWLCAQAMHSFFHRDNVALPGFSAMFKVCPTWMLQPDTAYRRLSLESRRHNCCIAHNGVAWCMAAWCMARAVRAKGVNWNRADQCCACFVQAANEEERDHALSLMHQQARITVRSIMSVLMTMQEQGRELHLNVALIVKASTT